MTTKTLTPTSGGDEIISKAGEIISTISQIEWKQMGNDGDPPPIDLWYALPSELDHHGSIRGALDRDLNRWQSEAYLLLFECFRAIGLDVQKVTLAEWEQIDVKEGDTPEIYDEKMQKLDEAVYFVFDQNKLLFNENPGWIASILEINNFLTMDSDKIYNQHRELIPFGYSEKQRQCARFDSLYFDLSSLIHYITQHYTTRSRKKKIDPQTVIPIYLRIMAEKIETIYSFWEFCRKFNKSLKPPLVPMVRACLIEQAAKPITREYDQTHPGSALPQKSVASVRYPFYEIIGETPTPSVEMPSAGQLLFPSFERKMYLPEYLPLQIVHGFDMTGRSGVLPYGMRFFFEVGMSLKPKARKGWYTKTLFDAAVDIGIVDPDSDKERKKYLRTEHKRAIANAIEGLNLIRLPYQEKVGGVGLWLPFRPQNVPTSVSEKDFPIRIEVNLPPDDTRGVLVTKEIIRSLYQHLAQLNAYLAACVLFNQHGISPKGNLIDPTEPDPNTRRLENGQYINPETNMPMRTKRGKPITDLYHPEAFEPLKHYRVYRKEADNYPTLEKEEIMRAAYPNEPWKQDGQPRRWEDKARKAWEAIAEKGYIRIEPKGNGLQILPSDSHVRLHHEFLKSSKKSQGT